MNLIKLEIKGFFSYREKVEIDWVPLLNSKFFGILGPTGAGKSSLLEAILIALYQKSLRTSYSPKSVLNSNEKEGYISLTFALGDDIYCVEYKSSREKASEHYLWLLGHDGSKKVLGAGKKVPEYIEKIIGMSYENFTRIFLLEQGSFQKFLRASGTEKAQLLGKLLYVPYLEKLADIVSGRIDGKKTSIKEKESEVNRLRADTSKEKEQEIQDRIDQYRRLSQEAESRLKEISQELERMSAMRSDWEELKKVRNQLHKLREEEGEYTKRSERIAQIKKIKQNISDIFGQLKGYENQIHNLSTQIQQKEAELSRLADQIETMDKHLRQLEEYWKNKELYQKQLAQLDDLQRYMDVRGKIESVSKEVRDLESGLQKIEDRIRAVEEKKQEMERHKEELENKQKYLAWEWLEWCRQREDLQKEIERLEKEISSTTEQLHKSRKSILDQLRACAGIEALISLVPEDKNKENWESWKTQVRESEIQLKNEIERKKAQLRLHEQLARLRPSLRVGDPCPICKTPLTEAHLASFPTAYNPEEIQKLEKWHSLLQEVRDKFYVIDGFIDNIEKKEAELKRKRNDLQEHLGKFRWGGEKEMEMTYGQLSRERKENEEKLEKVKSRIDEMSKQKDELLQKKRSQEEVISNKQKQIDRYEGMVSEISKNLPPEWLGKDGKWMEEEKNRLQECRRKAEEYQELSERKKQEESAMMLKKSSKDELIKQLENLKDKAEQIKNQMREEAGKLGVTMEFAREMCESTIDLDKEEEEIKGFFESLRRYTQKEQELAPKVSSYNEEEHKKLEQDKEKYLSELQRYQQELGRAEQEQVFLNQNRQRLSLLEKELSDLIEEYKNLEELHSLLSRKRFSQYVLRSFLDQILRRANAYLLQWTGGMWELAVLEEESAEKTAVASPSLAQQAKASEAPSSAYQLEIAVIDRFGKKEVRRNVDTLSGGQTFQASLALALALADYVRSRLPHSRLPKFFLIDEGFGTLDAETLNIVVQTLHAAAQKTQSTIGVITHREELKEYLGAYLRVQLEDHERLGKTSRVYPSWPKSTS